jgi:ATP-dependent helicase/nuclease subunit A
VVPVRRQGRAGSAVGRAVHATLQVVDLADPCDVEGLARRHAELEAVPDAADQVARTVHAALASPVVREAAAAVHHKELFVSAPVGGRAIEGYVDLLVERADGLVVVDYKTDSARTDAEIDERLAAYELQGASYAVALEEVTGRPVVECCFVFCRPGGAVERSVADLDAAKARVRVALA